MKKLLMILGAAGVAVGAAIPAFAEDPYWTGNAGDLKLGTAENWSTGSVPTEGNVNISLTTAQTLTNDDDSTFAPDSITFPSGSALVTISGGKAITGLLAITNSASGVHHVFNCPVAFAEDTDADITASGISSTYIKYLGGMTMHKPKFSSYLSLSGQIKITAEIDDWTANKNIGLIHLWDSGTKLAISSSVEVKGCNNFQLDAGTTVEIDGDYIVSAPDTTTYFANSSMKANSFAYDNRGVVKATGRIATGAANVRFGASSNSKNGVLAARQFHANGRFVLSGWNGGSSVAEGGTLVVGAGGMTASSGSDFYIQASSTALTSTIRPSADFAVDANLNVGLSSSSKYNGNFTFNTTDYYDETIGRKITLNKAVTHANILRANGKGTLLFNAAGSNAPLLIANDTCTVAVNPGCQPGSGNVTLNGQPTLKVAKSGTVTLGGTLTLYSEGTTLAFNFSERSTAPKLVIPALSFSGGNNTTIGAVNVKISADDGVRPKQGAYVIASSQSGSFTGKTINVVEAPSWLESVTVNSSGELVCNVKPAGLIISFY